MKIYTKTGDDGTTGLIGPGRVRKDDVRIEAYGEVDEMNAVLGLLLTAIDAEATVALDTLQGIQNDLFVIGSLLATAASAEKAPVKLDADRVAAIEAAIDAMEKELPELKNFILPQGGPAAATAHVARAVCRRAERRVVALSGLEPVAPAVLEYLNRLSDYLFVLARWLNRREGAREIPWTGSGAPAPKTDRLEATLRKLDDDKKKRQTLFERAANDLQRKKEAAEKLFRQEVDHLKGQKEPIEKPMRDIDLD